MAWRVNLLFDAFGYGHVLHWNKLGQVCQTVDVLDFLAELGAGEQRAKCHDLLVFAKKIRVSLSDWLEVTLWRVWWAPAACGWTKRGGRLSGTWGSSLTWKVNHSPSTCSESLFIYNFLLNVEKLKLSRLWREVGKETQAIFSLKKKSS